ncbi:hypothetical protein H4R34_000981 [Dimargaris verticillata]|uniref:Hydrophobic surface binding protein A-domain-containing protein n=1 Tax=Dimargaris verticillata TaxID=2761393 RepID=A0A9W8B741_9FUNG|nr:hypothetical protein H4R34_000981 [Dimargaris verticillata]
MKSVLILGTLVVLATFAQLPVAARPTDSPTDKPKSPVDLSKIEVPSITLASRLRDNLEEFGDSKRTVKLTDTSMFKYVKSEESGNDGDFITKTFKESGKAGLAKVVDALVSQGKDIIDAAPNKLALASAAEELADLKMDSTNGDELGAVQAVHAAFNKLETMIPDGSFRVKGYFASVSAKLECIEQQIEDSHARAEAKAKSKN